MTGEPDHLVLEILRHLQADMADLKEGQRTTNVHLAAIESQAEFLLAVGVHTDQLTSSRQRIERIERRPDLADPPTT